MKVYVISALLLLFGIGNALGQRKPAVVANSAIPEGSQAPELKVKEWFSEKPDLKGKFIALDFWSVTCKPCIAGFAHVNELHRKYKDKVVFIATSTDKNPESVYVFDSGPTIEFYSMLPQDKEIYKIKYIPYMILIDPKGIVRFSGNGFDLTESKLDEIIEKYGI